MLRELRRCSGGCGWTARAGGRTRPGGATPHKPGASTAPVRPGRPGSSSAATALRQVRIPMPWKPFSYYAACCGTGWKPAADWQSARRGSKLRLPLGKCPANCKRRVANPPQINNLPHKRFSNIDRLRPNHEAVTVAFEAQGVVELVRAFALHVAGERQLVAAAGAALGAGMFHHGAPHAAALAFRQHGHVFHDAGPGAAFRQIVENQQRIRAGEGCAFQRHEHTVIRIGTKARQMLAGLFHGEGLASVDSGAGVGVKDGGQVRFGGLANDDFAHTENTRSRSICAPSKRAEHKTLQNSSACPCRKTQTHRVVGYTTQTSMPPFAR